LRFFSCVLVPIFCFCLFLGILALVIINVKNINFKNTKANTTSTETNDVLNKFNVEKNGSQTKIVLSEDDLNVLAKENLGNLLSSPKSKIYSDKIELSGTLNNFFDRKASISLKPKINNNKLSVEIIDIKISFFGTPEFIRNQVSRSINKIIEQKVNTKNNIENILLENGQMTVILK
jgi:hypothetical protein